METAIGTAATRAGRSVTVRHVLAPDDEWAARIIPFLGHKAELWQWQMDQLLRSRFEPLAFHCYLADLAEEGGSPQIVGTVCTIESHEVGLFGHVFTEPAHRGQSIARILTDACIGEFQARGGLGLWLVTDYDTTPYRVYRQFGFESIAPEEGIMVWFADGGRPALERRFAGGQAVRPRPMDWPDYATLNALSCWPAGPPYRSTALEIIGQNIVEFTYLRLKKAMQSDRQIQARVLATPDDWPVGWAILKPTAGVYAPYRQKGSPVVLDLYAHPNYEADYPRLLASVQLPPDRKVIATIDSQCPARERALLEAGFVVEGRLTRVFRWRDEPVDLVHLARNPD